MHLKIPTNNLTAAGQPPGRMAADKAKGTPSQEMAVLSNKTPHHNPAQPQFATYQ